MFKRHGLDLALNNYQVGAYAVNDLVEGKVDVAGARSLCWPSRGSNGPTSGRSRRLPRPIP